MVLDHIPPSDKAPEQEIVHAKFVVGADGETRSDLDHVYATDIAPMLRRAFMGSKDSGIYDGWGTDR